ncbi:tape measure protein [Colidextribacter sp. 210702-DFI.3.9]|nr:tape measure protein [Colidextribacter sp. 210702-DFI.3.9]
MAERVTIEVEARFVDNLSGAANQAGAEVKDLGNSAEKAEKQVDNLGKKKAKPTVDADDSGFVKKLLNAERKIKKLVGKPVIATLKVMDKGVDVVNKVENGLKKVAGKTWSTAVRIKDYATAPLRKVKDMLFSIKSLVLAITAGLAAKKLVMDPVSLADSYSSAKIGFSTLLGDSQGQKMMDDLDAFAKATPFKTSEVIANTQKMIAMGWEAKDIIKDMETIGDAAAATGKGDEGLNRIILALSQIKSKGKLSTEELNQLAEAGISAKRYLAEGLGYGSGDNGIAALSKDLEQGKIGSERAIQAIMAGMKEYKGMMDKTANETVKGLWGQIEDTFEINIFRRWGQGLQDGAKRGLGTVVGLLDKADTSLSKFGNTVYDIGEAFSSWAADKLENTIKRIGDITDSFEFQNADLGGKLKLLWKSAVADPFAEWWSDEESVQKATELGESFAKSLTQGILTVLGITDIFADVGDDSGSKGYNVAQGFARGFVDGFDVSAITGKIVEAIGNVWGALPLWAKVLVGGHVAGKVMGGISNFAKGTASFIGKPGVIGAGNVVTGASGLLGTMSSTGYALLGGASSATPGIAALAGGAGIAGGVVGGIALGKGVYDLYGSYKAYKAGNTTEAEAKKASGGNALAGVTVGAGLGALVGGPLGALIGAGVGGAAGILIGAARAKIIRKEAAEAKYETEEMQKVMADTNATAEEMAQTMDKAVWDNLKDHFGDIELSMSEIKRIAEQITMGDASAGMDQFKTASQQAEASLSSLQSAGETVNRWMWKAGLGVKFSEDEQASIKKAFDDYISSAKSYVENKHYEFTAAVRLLVDVESGAGKDVLRSGDSYYSQIQEKLNDLGAELDGKVKIALQDGIITLDEEKEVTSLQNQIAEITNRLANAEADAKLETIKIKFGGEGNITLESFQNLQSQLQTTLEEQISNYDTALTASITSLNLQLDDGAISKDEYDAQLQALMDGYEAKVDGMKVKATNLQLDILGSSYQDILGEDSLSDLQHALQNAIDTGIDPIQWSDEKVAHLLGVDQLGPETAETLRRALQAVLDAGVPDRVEKTISLDITGAPKIEKKVDISAYDFGIPDSISKIVKIKLDRVVTASGSLQTGRTSSSSQIMGGKARGGIIGGPAEGFAMGGRPADGMLRGSTRFIRVNEEAPEMIIPLSSQRRERALKLWAKTGKLLDVPGFARGGSTGNRDEGIRFQRFGGDAPERGDQSVQVNVGGVNVTIQVDTNNSGSVLETIRAQAGEIAEAVAGVMADAMVAQFENTPLRGGA